MLEDTADKLYDSEIYRNSLEWRANQNFENDGRNKFVKYLINVSHTSRGWVSIEAFDKSYLWNIRKPILPDKSSAC